MKETLNKQLEQDKALMNALKVNSISHTLCSTDKGDLKLFLRKGSNAYELVLDQIPLTPEEATFVTPHIDHLI